MEDGSNVPRDVAVELSKRAKKINIRKLESVPWAHDGSHPSSPWFWKFLIILLMFPWSYLFRKKEVEQPYPTDGGRLCVATHVNGLVDPIAITLSHPKQRMVTLGRHDLTTSVPVISWIARRIGSQPVIRKAEQIEGIAEIKFAQKLNERSMLTVSHALSGGYRAIIMPEGTGHQDSRLRHLRTGSMRSAINAASISKERNIPPPVFQPIGLHFRVHYWFRTDLYVEQIEPISVPYNPNKEQREKLMQGTWVEPPEGLVIQLRDELSDKLAYISRDAPNWQTYRSWQLLAHLTAKINNINLKSYKEEVHATRAIRDKTRSFDSDEMVEHAKLAAEILHSYDLDGRVIKSDLSIKSESNYIKGFLGLAIMLLCSPITIYSTGIQIFLAWYLGNNTDEGIDARTTYHMLASLISPLIFWPILSLISFLIISEMIFPISFFIFPLYLFISMVIYHTSNIVFLYGYDFWSDYQTSRRCKILTKSTNADKLKNLLENLEPMLDALK
jgi:1-acyl-sn-glycerol-3-phosphate acyltransferase